MKNLITRQDGQVLTIELNNPPFNFLTDPLMTELETLLKTVDRDRNIRAVVLTSAVPEVFISHYDVGEILAGSQSARVFVPPRMATLALRVIAMLRGLPVLRRVAERGPAAGVTSLLRYHAVTRRMRRSDTVFIAAVNGRALGGGCELTLACDIRIMATDAGQIGQPEILIGLLPGGGGLQMLTRTVGIGATLDLALEGTLFTPQQALEAGIVQHLTSPDELQQTAQATAARLARRSPAAVRSIKRAVYDGGTGRLERGLAMERTSFMSLATRKVTKTAMRQYGAIIAEYEESGADLSTFIDDRLPDWQDGIAADFTSNGSP